MVFHCILCQYFLLAVLPFGLSLSSPFPFCFICLPWCNLANLSKCSLALSYVCSLLLSLLHFWGSPQWIWSWLFCVTWFWLSCILSSSLWSYNITCSILLIHSQLSFHVSMVPLHHVVLLQLIRLVKEIFISVSVSLFDRGCLFFSATWLLSSLSYLMGGLLNLSNKTCQFVELEHGWAW